MKFIEQILNDALKQPVCSIGVRRFRAVHISPSLAHRDTHLRLFIDFAKASNVEKKVNFTNSTVDIVHIFDDGIKTEITAQFIPITKEEDTRKLLALEVSDFINESSSAPHWQVSQILKSKCRYKPYGRK